MTSVPAVTDEAISLLAGRVTQRWREADLLLPAADPARPGCGASFAVAGADGEITGYGTCEHWEGEPGSLDLTWGAAQRYELTAHAAGPGVAAALDALLTQWSEHRADLAGTAAPDTAAIVTWPSRDVAGVRPLLRHGFAPLAVIAARAARRDSAGQAGQPQVPSGLDIRRAEPADIGALVALGLEVVRFDAHFGGVNERAWTAEALTRELADLLAGPQPWLWLAEREGRPVGMLAAERPAQARWIAGRAAPDPVAYLLLMGVRAAERAAGIGAALASQLNAETEAGQAAVTLLHYAQVNPLSAPFWSQQGYRPLWTCWESRPAAADRTAP